MICGRGTKLSVLLPSGEGGAQRRMRVVVRLVSALFILLVACGKDDVDKTDTREAIAIQYVGVADLPVHSQPGDIAPVITHYRHGESISVMSRKRDWAEVRTALG